MILEVLLQLLLAFGLLSTPEEWNTLTPAQQDALRQEIIIEQLDDF